jgi:hypothetical protein
MTGAHLRLAEVVDTNCGDYFQAQKFCCFDPTVTGDDPVVTIDQEWIGESKLAARSSDLVNLFVGMNARVAPIWLQRRNCTKCDTQILELRTDRFVVRYGAAPTIGGEA